jgi:hypothetical protein
MEIPQRYRETLICAHCKQQIGLLATYICFNSGEKERMFHLSCHQTLLRQLAPADAG